MIKRRKSGQRANSKNGVCICGQCGKTYPHTTEFFAPSKQCKNNVSGTCRICRRKWFRKSRANDDGKHLTKQRQYYHQKYDEIQSKKAAAFRHEFPYIVKARIMRSGILNAKRRGISCNTTLFTTLYLYCWLRSIKKCPCCGVTFNIERSGKSYVARDNSPSLDKIRPEHGYVAGNVAMICWRCNNLKRNSNPIELFKVVKWMRKVWDTGVKLFMPKDEIKQLGRIGAISCASIKFKKALKFAERENIRVQNITENNNK
jgi:hypothetical protein